MSSLKNLVEGFIAEGFFSCLVLDSCEDEQASLVSLSSALQLLPSPPSPSTSSNPRTCFFPPFFRDATLSNHENGTETQLQKREMGTSLQIGFGATSSLSAKPWIALHTLIAKSKTPQAKPIVFFASSALLLNALRHGMLTLQSFNKILLCDSYSLLSTQQHAPLALCPTYYIFKEFYWPLHSNEGRNDELKIYAALRPSTVALATHLASQQHQKVHFQEILDELRRCYDIEDWWKPNSVAQAYPSITALHVAPVPLNLHYSTVFGSTLPSDLVLNIFDELVRLEKDVSLEAAQVRSARVLREVAFEEGILDAVKRDSQEIPVVLEQEWRERWENVRSLISRSNELLVTPSPSKSYNKPNKYRLILDWIVSRCATRRKSGAKFDRDLSVSSSDFKKVDLDDVVQGEEHLGLAMLLVVREEMQVETIFELLKRTMVSDPGLLPRILLKRLQKRRRERYVETWRSYAEGDAKEGEMCTTSSEAPINLLVLSKRSYLAGLWKKEVVQPLRDVKTSEVSDDPLALGSGGSSHLEVLMCCNETRLCEMLRLLEAADDCTEEKNANWMPSVTFCLDSKHAKTTWTSLEAFVSTYEVPKLDATGSRNVEFSQKLGFSSLQHPPILQFSVPYPSQLMFSKCPTHQKAIEKKQDGDRQILLDPSVAASSSAQPSNPTQKAPSSPSTSSMVPPTLAVSVESAWMIVHRWLHSLHSSSSGGVGGSGGIKLKGSIVAFSQPDGAIESQNTEMTQTIAPSPFFESHMTSRPPKASTKATTMDALKSCSHSTTWRPRRRKRVSDTSIEWRSLELASGSALPSSSSFQFAALTGLSQFLPSSASTNDGRATVLAALFPMHSPLQEMNPILPLIKTESSIGTRDEVLKSLSRTTKSSEMRSAEFSASLQLQRGLLYQNRQAKKEAQYSCTINALCRIWSMYLLDEHLKPSIQPSPAPTAIASTSPSDTPSYEIPTRLAWIHAYVRHLKSKWATAASPSPSTFSASYLQDSLEDLIKFCKPAENFVTQPQESETVLEAPFPPITPKGSSTASNSGSDVSVAFSGGSKKAQKRGRGFGAGRPPVAALSVPFVPTRLSSSSKPEPLHENSELSADALESSLSQHSEGEALSATSSSSVPSVLPDVVWHTHVLVLHIEVELNAEDEEEAAESRASAPARSVTSSAATSDFTPPKAPQQTQNPTSLGDSAKLSETRPKDDVFLFILSPSRLFSADQLPISFNAADKDHRNLRCTLFEPCEHTNLIPPIDTLAHSHAHHPGSDSSPPAEDVRRSMALTYEAMEELKEYHGKLFQLAKFQGNSTKISPDWSYSSYQYLVAPAIFTPRDCVSESTPFTQPASHLSESRHGSLCIDWCSVHQALYGMNRPNSSSSGTEEYESSWKEWIGAIVYYEHQPEQRYLVKNVSFDKSPLSPSQMNPDITLAEAMLQKFKHTMRDSNQPLFSVKMLSIKSVNGLAVSAASASSAALSSNASTPQKQPGTATFESLQQANPYRYLFLVPEMVSLFFKSKLPHDIITTLPSLIYRIESYLRVKELIERLNLESAKNAGNRASQTWPLLSNLELALNATTPVGAGEEFNYEMLESIGDNVLKLYVAFFLSRRGGGLGKEGCGFDSVMKARRASTSHDGASNWHRNWSLNNRFVLESWSHRWISNAHLCTSAMSLGVDQMMNLGFIHACQQIGCVKVSAKTAPTASSTSAIKPIPFALDPPMDLQSLTGTNANTVTDKPKQETNPFSIFISGLVHPPPPASTFPYAAPNYSNSLLSEKAIADCAEAILGACFESSGTSSADLFFLAFGMPEMAMSTNSGHVISRDGDSNMIEGTLEMSNSISPSQISIVSESDHLHPIERTMQYKWKNKALLVEALTHESLLASNSNVSVSCYHSLCTLGDALFDHFILRYIVKHVPNVTPGEFTHLKSVGVCGYAQALLAHHLGLSTHILHASVDLKVRLESFERVVSDFEFVGDVKKGVKLTPREYAREQHHHGRPFWHYTGLDYPEALALCLEALVGAVFEDLGGNVETTWSLLEPLFTPFWDALLLKHIASGLISPWPKALLASLQQNVVELRRNLDAQVLPSTTSATAVAVSANTPSTVAAAAPCRAYYEAPPVRLRIAAAYFVDCSYHALRACGMASTRRIAQSDSALRALYKLVASLPHSTDAISARLVRQMATLCTCSESPPSTVTAVPTQK